MFAPEVEPSTDLGLPSARMTCSSIHLSRIYLGHDTERDFDTLPAPWEYGGRQHADASAAKKMLRDVTNGNADTSSFLWTPRLALPCQLSHHAAPPRAP